jgi:hypothetical protein
MYGMFELMDMSTPSIRHYRFDSLRFTTFQPDFSRPNGRREVNETDGCEVRFEYQWHS